MNNNQEFSSDALVRYAKILKGRLNRVPNELFELLNLKSSQYATDFIKIMYIPQSFVQFGIEGLEEPKKNSKAGLFEIIEANRYIFIVGGAGSGKTTTTKFITNELCDDILRMAKGEATDFAYMTGGVDSVIKEIKNIRSNLSLIEERISEYPLSTDVPLILVKEQSEKQARLNSLIEVASQRSEQTEDQKNILIPIYISLGDLSDYLAGHSAEKLDFHRILKFVVERNFDTLEGLEKILFESIERGDAFIILDGFDELGEIARQRLLTTVVDLIRLYSPHVVLTTREHALVSVPEVAMFHIEAFDFEQIDDYIVRWYTDIYKQSGSVYERRLFAWSLYRKIKEGGLLHLARNPLILAQIVILHKDKDDITLSNIVVIQKILRLLMFRWRSGLYESYNSFKNLRDEIKLGDEDLLKIASAVAFNMLRFKSYNPEAAILRPHVVEWIQIYLESIEINHVKAAEIILDFLQNCDGLLNATSTKPQNYYFSNNKIQEYLAAYYLVNSSINDEGYTEQLPELIDKNLGRWSGATAFVCDLLPKNAAVMFVDFLIRTFLPSGDSYSAYEKVLMCGTIVNKFKDKGYQLDVYEKSVNNLHENVEKIVNSPDAKWQQAVLAADILGSLGDKRSNLSSIFKEDYWFNVPAGEFEMGIGNERHLVKIDKFDVAKYVVTNEQFHEFVKATNFRTLPENWEIEKPYLHKKNYPVIGLHWNEALQFADWINKLFVEKGLMDSNEEIIIRLPTEAEWEKSAVGFRNREAFMNEIQQSDKSEDFLQFVWDHRVWPIGLACVNGIDVKVLDMFNNVWEWTISSYDSYPYRDDDGRNSRYQNQPKAIRGGYSPLGDVEFLRTTRNQCHMYRPVYKINNVGFRLARGRSFS